MVWGCVSQVGEQTNDIARTAVLAAGWPDTVPGVTVDRQCGSGQQAILFAAAGIAAGHYDIAVAGGVETMSRVPMGAAAAIHGEPIPAGLRDRFGGTPTQGVGAELIAEKWGLDRLQLDDFAVQSHRKAASAQDNGHFDRQLIPLTLDDGRTVTADEGVRRNTTIDVLGQLKPAFKEDGKIHAGNASQISDGSAALLLMTEEKAAEFGLTPLARIHSTAVLGADPVMMLTAPIPATEAVLRKAHLGVDDIGVFEVNEAFASVPLAWLKDIGADPARLNPNGGAIALGHPLGGSGARIMTTMLHHMRDNGIRFGLQTMCEGGGQANATIVELM